MSVMVIIITIIKMKWLGPRLGTGTTSQMGKCLVPHPRAGPKADPLSATNAGGKKCPGDEAIGTTVVPQVLAPGT